jgi:hypothetical protein
MEKMGECPVQVSHPGLSISFFCCLLSFSQHDQTPAAAAFRPDMCGPLPLSSTCKRCCTIPPRAPHCPWRSLSRATQSQLVRCPGGWVFCRHTNAAKCPARLAESNPPRRCCRLLQVGQHTSADSLGRPLISELPRTAWLSHPSYSNTGRSLSG